MKTITRDTNGFLYKNKRSKSSKVKVYFGAPIETVRQNFVVTETELQFVGKNVSVRLGLKTGALVVNELIDPIFNKYGKKTSVNILTTNASLTIVTFKELCAALDAA